MDPIEFRNIAVIPFGVSNTFGWRFQVIVGAGPIPVSGISPLARLGAQTIEGIQVAPDGQGFGGYLRSPATDGDQLFFRYPGMDETDTGLVYRDLVA